VSATARLERPAALGTSAATVIWRSRFLRSAFLALFISGLAVSSTMPQMTLYLVNDLGASVPVAGLYYLTNFAAPLAGYWVGSLSDRQENRLTLYRACALLGGFGWLAMALATQVWMPFIIAGVVLSFSGGSMGLLFAAVRDDLSRQHSPAADRVVSAVRMAFTRRLDHRSGAGQLVRCRLRSASAAIRCRRLDRRSDPAARPAAGAALCGREPTRVVQRQRGSASRGAGVPPTLPRRRCTCSWPPACW
jgi:Major Facilitator Superfamily